MKTQVYKPVKYDTNIKGYWKDENGKLYIDNIVLVDVNNAPELEMIFARLFQEGEKAVFLTDGKKAFIVGCDGSTDILSRRAVYEIVPGTVSSVVIDDYIAIYGACTVCYYPEYNKSTVTIWQN
jgi:hypothetical protein